MGRQPEKLRYSDNVEHTTDARPTAPQPENHSLARSRLGREDQHRDAASGQEHHIGKVNFHGAPTRAAVQLIMHGGLQNRRTEKIDLTSYTDDDVVKGLTLGPALKAGLQDGGHLVAPTAELPG